MVTASKLMCKFKKLCHCHSISKVPNSVQKAYSLIKFCDKSLNILGDYVEQ